MTGAANGTAEHKSLVSLSPFVGCAPTVADGTGNTLVFSARRETAAVSLNLASGLSLLVARDDLYSGTVTDCKKIPSFFLLYRIQMIYSDPGSHLRVPNSSTSGSYFGFEPV